MQVKEIMNKKIITVKRSTTLGQLLETFSKFHTFPLVPVVEEGNCLVGVISFQSLIDVFRPLELEVKHLLKRVPFVEHEEEDIFKTEIAPELDIIIIVDDLMSKRFHKIKEDSLIEDAYNFMRLHDVETLPVVNEKDQLVGMIGIFDILLSVFRQKGIIK